MAFKEGIIIGPSTLNGGAVNIGTDNAGNAITIGTGTVARTIDIGFSAAAHGIRIGVAFGAASMSIQSGSGGAILNSVGGTTDVAGSLGATVSSAAGSVLLDGVGVVELNSSGAAISIGNDANNFAINIGTLGTRTINIGSAAASIDIGGFAEGALVTASTGVVSTITGTTGFVLTANAAASAPTFQASRGIAWSEISALGPTTMVINNGYSANNAGQVVLTLPAVAAVGDGIRVTGKGAGGWKINQNAGQTIFFGTSTSTPGAGGSLASTAQRDSIELVCVTANNDWNVLSVIGNITVV